MYAPDNQTVVTDDRFELLLSLSPVVPLDAAIFMAEHGWCGQRFAEAIYGIRTSMRIALSTGDTGEAVTIRRRHWPRAQWACESYLQRTYGGDVA